MIHKQNSIDCNMNIFSRIEGGKTIKLRHKVEGFSININEFLWLV